MDTKRSADEDAHRESLDVAFWLRPEQLTRPASVAGIDATHPEREVFAPAQRVGEILHAVASALCEIPFDHVHAIEIRRLSDLTVGKNASLETPIEVRARAVGTDELTGGRPLTVIHCRLTNQFGECVATFSVETETVSTAETPTGSTGVQSTTGRIATTETDFECVDNIPV